AEIHRHQSIVHAVRLRPSTGTQLGRTSAPDQRASALASPALTAFSAASSGATADCSSSPTLVLPPHPSVATSTTTPHTRPRRISCSLRLAGAHGAVDVVTGARPPQWTSARRSERLGTRRGDPGERQTDPGARAAVGTRPELHRGPFAEQPRHALLRRGQAE